jgi:putative tricarboxylic transport membrane protein
MRNSGRAASFLVFFSLFICIESYRMGLGALSTPGPGLFPMGAGLVLGFLSVLSVLGSLLQKGTSPATAGSGRYNILLVLCALIAYGMLLEWAGFLITTFSLLVFLLKVIVPQGWARVLCSAFLSTLASYLIFEVCLRAQMPRGFIGF